MCKGMGFGVNTNVYERMPKVAKLNLNTTRQIEQEWLSEAYLKIIEGKKDIGTVELSAYSKICERVSALERAKAGEVPMLDSNETIMGYEGIQADFVTDTKAIKAFDEVEANADVNYYIENFTDMWEYVCLENGSDIWVLLNLAKQDDKKAQAKLRAITKEFDYLEDIISFVIRNPLCFKVLEDIFQYTIEMAS